LKGTPMDSGCLRLFGLAIATVAILASGLILSLL
jgi:hypothetical protein